MLFAERNAHRLQIAALGENAASRGVAERLGFTLEGVFRAARLHRGAWHDLAWYAVTEDEWRARGSRAAQQ
ncbi:putative ribosomal N-acetyltransferase YdaF [compost metagenome]